MQAQAFMPVRKMLDPGTAFGLALQHTRMRPAAASITQIRHCPASMTGSAMRCTRSEMMIE